MKGNFKDLRKASFAIAFGTVMGKYAADRLSAILDGAILHVCDRLDKVTNKMQQKTDSQ